MKDRDLMIEELAKQVFNKVLESYTGREENKKGIARHLTDKYDIKLSHRKITDIYDSYYTKARVPPIPVNDFSLDQISIVLRFNTFQDFVDNEKGIEIESQKTKSTEFLEDSDNSYLIETPNEKIIIVMSSPSDESLKKYNKVTEIISSGEGNCKILERFEPRDNPLNLFDSSVSYSWLLEGTLKSIKDLSEIIISQMKLVSDKPEELFILEKPDRLVINDSGTVIEIRNV